MSNAVKHLLEFGPFRIDPELRLLLRAQQPIPLSPKAFELLLVLAQRSGQVVLKDDLMKILWPDTFVEESNLGQHVFQLRKALGERAQYPSYIVTVPGRGYRFAQRVRTIPAQADEEIVLESHSRSRVVIEEESPPERTPATAAKARAIRVATWFAAALVALVAAALLRTPEPPPKVVGVRQITHSGRVKPYSKVVTDGSRLYFTQIAGGTGALAEVPAGGGEPTLISTSVPSLEVYDIDPGKSRLLIGTRGPNFNQPLWVVPTAGGSGQRLGDMLASESAAWSPDGHSILYGHDSQIYMLSEEGSEPVRLLTAPGYVISLRLSPDGKLLRFTVRDSASGANSLWESSADGRNPHPLSLGWKAATSPWGEGEAYGNWTPDGRYFVFRSVRDGVASFWAIREKRDWLHRHTGLPVQLYTSPDRIGEPRFSPDGKKIFFANYQERRELVRYDGARKLFVPYLGGISARLLSFSPDGKWVAYQNNTDGTLWRSRVDGTEKLQLTFPPLQALHSSWSPDGKRIAFEGRPPGEAARLYAVPSDGGKPEALTSPEASDTGPSWSPDGRLILFQRWTTNETGSRHSAICVLDLNTGQTRFLPGTQDFDGVHWSPDGKYAAAADQGNYKLMLFDFTGQRWSELTDGAAYGWGIRWSSDSRYVYYQHADEEEEQPIFRVRISDRRIEQITSARQILRTDVLVYSMTGLTPDNSPLASLAHRNSDIYVLDIDLP
jgi:Tol biopolymer transport system component/DNA-binding winged helix-turn-helix (wHTH) protein